MEAMVCYKVNACSAVIILISNNKIEKESTNVMMSMYGHLYRLIM